MQSCRLFHRCILSSQCKFLPYCQISTKTPKWHSLPPPFPGLQSARYCSYPGLRAGAEQCALSQSTAAEQATNTLALVRAVPAVPSLPSPTPLFVSLLPRKSHFFQYDSSLMKLTAFKSLPLSPFPTSMSVCRSSKLTVSSFTCTPRRKSHKPEKQKVRGSPRQAGRSMGTLKSILTNPGNFHKLIPANAPVLRSFPGVPILISVLQGSVGLGTIMHTAHYTASWVAANPKRHASPNIAAPFNCLAYLPSLLHGS